MSINVLFKIIVEIVCCLDLNYVLFNIIMSGTPAIDTRSQNSFIKQKKSKRQSKQKSKKM